MSIRNFVFFFFCKAFVNSTAFKEKTDDSLRWDRLFFGEIQLKLEKILP